MVGGRVVHADEHGQRPTPNPWCQLIATSSVAVFVLASMCEKNHTQQLIIFLLNSALLEVPKSRCFVPLHPAARRQDGVLAGFAQHGDQRSRSHRPRHGRHVHQPGTTSVDVRIAPHHGFRRPSDDRDSTYYLGLVVFLVHFLGVGVVVN